MKINQHIIFLKQCKKEDVIPNGMHLNNVKNINKNKILLYKTMKTIKNNMLEWRYKQKRYITNEITTQEKILNLYLNENHPERNHEQDLGWINKHDKNKKKKN